MSTRTRCDQCDTAMPMNATKWIEVEVPSEVFGSPSKLDFCTWACVGQFAMHRAAVEDAQR